MGPGKAQAAQEIEAEESEARELEVEQLEAGKAAAREEPVVEWFQRALQRALPRASRELARLRVAVYKRRRIWPAE